MSPATAADLERLLKVPALASVPERTLATLIEASEMEFYETDQRLILQGERSHHAMVLLEGEVAIVHESQHGRSPLAHATAPALFGEIAAFTGFARSASVIATQPCRALRVQRPALLEASRHNPEILIAVVAQLGGHLESVNQALGMYADGFAALENGAFAPSILEDLTHPTEEVKEFAAAFTRLARHIEHQKKTRDEMASAAMIQHAMLPRDLAALPLAGRCDLHGDMSAARDVGGDLYDLFMLDADRLALVIGDVCGKGVPAALFMSQTITTLRMAARTPASVASVVETANDILCAQNPAMMFVTLFYGVLDLSTGRLDYVNAGHNPPLLLRADGANEPLAKGRPPLGLVPGARYPAHAADLGCGEGVFLYTDGVTESIDPTGEEFGTDRLSEVLAGLVGRPAAERIDEVMTRVSTFAAGADPFDDITCVCALRP